MWPLGFKIREPTSSQSLRICCFFVRPCSMHFSTTRRVLRDSGSLVLIVLNILERVKREQELNSTEKFSLLIPSFLKKHHSQKTGRVSSGVFSSD